MAPWMGLSSSVSRVERDHTPRLGDESQGKPVAGSFADNEVAHVHPGWYHGCRVEIHRVPVKAGVGT